MFKNELSEQVGKADLAGLSLTMQLIEKPVFMVKDTGVTSRVYKLWSDEGVLYTSLRDSNDSADKVRAWFRFTFVEYLWVKIVAVFRGYGMSFKQIRNVRNMLCRQLSREEAAAVDGVDIDPIDIILGLMKSAPAPNAKLQQEKEVALQWLNDPANRKRLSETYKPSASIFEILVTRSIIGQERIDLHVYPDQTTGVFANGQMESFYQPIIKAGSKSEHFEVRTVSFEETRKRLFPQPFLHIPLTYFITEFLTDETKAKFILEYHMLKDEELEVIRSLRSGNVKQVSIEYDDKQQETFDIITKRSKQVDTETYKRIMQAMVTQPHISITMKTIDGKTVYYTREKRKRIKKQ